MKLHATLFAILAALLLPRTSALAAPTSPYATGLETRVAVWHSHNGAHAQEMDASLKYLGWAVDKFPSTDESMKRFCQNRSQYDLVLVLPLFNTGAGGVADMGVYAPEIQAFLQSGGGLMIVDANYPEVLDWLGKVDPCLALGREGPCSQPTRDVLPLDPLLTLPERVHIGGHWAHLIPPAGSTWETVTECVHRGQDGSERKHPTVVAQRFGKGIVFVMNTRPKASGALNNLRVNLEAQRHGLRITGFDMPEKLYGTGSVKLGIRNLAAKPTRTAVSMSVAMLPKTSGGKEAKGAGNRINSANATRFGVGPVLVGAGREQAFEIPYSLPTRGPAMLEISVITPDGAVCMTKRRIVIPEMFEIEPPSYRGLLSEKRRGDTVGLAMHVHPGKPVPKLSRMQLQAIVLDARGLRVSAHTDALAEGRNWIQMPFPKSLPPGSYKVQGAVVLDGRPAARAETSFSVLKYEEGQVVIDDDHALLVDGKPFFPLGLYHVPVADYPRVAELGFNMVQVWSWQLGEQALDQAQATGLKVMMEFAQNSPDLYREKWHGLVSRHPALAILYVADEPHEPDYERLRGIKAVYEEMDLNHPSYLATDSHHLVPTQREFCDIIAPISYPYWREGGDMLEVAVAVDNALAGVRGRQTVFALPQAFGHEDVPALRAMAYLAVAHEARGIVWYTWNQVGGGKPGIGLHENPEAQAGFKAILSEIKTISPALLNGGRERFTAGPATWEIHGLFCQDPETGRNYVVMVNPRHRAVTATVRHERLKNVSKIEDAFGERSLPVANASFQIQFEPAGTAVYAW